MNSQENFIEAVMELARNDGVDHILMIPGVLEVVIEYYNNDAIELMVDSIKEE